LFFVSAWALGQEKDCLFPRDSITRPDRLQTKQLVKEIAAMQLTPSYAVKKIPGFILEALKCWTWNKEWSIAEPDGDFNVGCDIKNNLPNRQLMYIGLNEHYMLIAYKYGGGVISNIPVMLFRFENEKIISVMYWYSSGREVKNKKDVMRTIKCVHPYVVASI
jgi:hypothetical protein